MVFLQRMQDIVMAGLLNSNVPINNQHSLRVYYVPGWMLRASYALFGVVLSWSPLDW